MAHATAEIKRWGNSLGIVIPRKVVKELKLSENEVVDINIRKKNRISGFGLCKGAPSFEEEKETHEGLL